MKQLAIGLISGTSMDGVDAALVEHDPDASPDLRLVAFATHEYPAALVPLLREASSATASQLTRLDAAVGAVFADAALAILERAGVDSGAVSCIGSHGQTICHLPAREPIAGIATCGSLQIGSPALIAARTRIDTVADFRAADMAAGGQGAPLAPLLDWRLYRHQERHRVLLNIGGIGNLTSLPADARLDEIIAFDTGPGNVLLDAVARAAGLPGGIDTGGRSAGRGKIDGALLDRLASHPFVHLQPPKSADTADFADALPSLTAGPHEDILATLTELTARTISDAIFRWVAPRAAVDELLVSGGGAHNQTLMRRLGELVEGAAVRAAPLVGGIPPDAKEAVLFALLGLERIAGRPGNVPAATGAERLAILGAVSAAPGSARTVGKA